MIRYARPADHDAIHAVVAEAFGRDAEADLVRKLRDNDDRLFELVADQDDRIDGHIFFSRLWADRPQLFGALAPLAVHPERQRQGVGGKLIRAGVDCAREFGCHGLLVLGDPAYYGRFGFAAETAKDVRAPFRGLAAFQALALEDSAFDAPLMIAYPDAFGAA